MESIEATSTATGTQPPETVEEMKPEGALSPIAKILNAVAVIFCAAAFISVIATVVVFVVTGWLGASYCCLSLVCGAVAFVLSFAARKKVRRDDKQAGKHKVLSTRKLAAVAMIASIVMLPFAFLVHGGLISIRTEYSNSSPYTVEAIYDDGYAIRYSVPSYPRMQNESVIVAELGIVSINSHGWVPQDKIQQVKEANSKTTAASSVSVDPVEEPNYIARNGVFVGASAIGAVYSQIEWDE